MEGKSLPAEEQRADGNYRSATSPGTDKPRRNTLRKTEILRGYGTYRRVLSNGKRLDSSGVRCYYVLNDAIPPGSVRVGFAVRGAKKAVGRNKIKRYLREAYRTEKHELHDICLDASIALECVFIASVQHIPAPGGFNEYKRAMQTLISKLCMNLG